MLNFVSPGERSASAGHQDKLLNPRRILVNPGELVSLLSPSLLSLPSPPSPSPYLPPLPPSLPPFPSLPPPPPLFPPSPPSPPPSSGAT